MKYWLFNQFNRDPLFHGLWNNPKCKCAVFHPQQIPLNTNNVPGPLFFRTLNSEVHSISLLGMGLERSIWWHDPFRPAAKMRRNRVWTRRMSNWRGGISAYIKGLKVRKGMNFYNYNCTTLWVSALHTKKKKQAAKEISTSKSCKGLVSFTCSKSANHPELPSRWSRLGTLLSLAHDVSKPGVPYGFHELNPACWMTGSWWNFMVYDI